MRGEGFVINSVGLLTIVGSIVLMVGGIAWVFFIVTAARNILGIFGPLIIILFETDTPSKLLLIVGGVTFALAYGCRYWNLTPACISTYSVDCLDSRKLTACNSSLVIRGIRSAVGRRFACYKYIGA